MENIVSHGWGWLWDSSLSYSHGVQIRLDRYFYSCSSYYIAGYILYRIVPLWEILTMSSKPMESKEAGMYVGEVVIGVKELSRAIEAAQRLLGTAYDKVVFNNPGEGGRHEEMMRDIFSVAKMLLQVSKAITDARLVAGSSREVH